MWSEQLLHVFEELRLYHATATKGHEEVRKGNTKRHFIDTTMDARRQRLSSSVIFVLWLVGSFWVINQDILMLSLKRD